jgi:hypothetical protein
MIFDHLHECNKILAGPYGNTRKQGRNKKLNEITLQVMIYRPLNGLGSIDYYAI